MIAALDTNIFIYVLEANPDFCDESINLLKYVESGSISAMASELVVLELHSGKTLNESKIKKLQDFIKSTQVKLIPIDTSVLLKAAELRRQHNLKTPDAIHLATAIIHKCNYFVTNDHLLLRMPKIQDLQIISIKKAQQLI